MGGRPQRILVVGVPVRGTSDWPGWVWDRVRGADILCGGRRHLAQVPAVPAERWPITDSVTELVAQLRETAGKQVVVLASGDPLLFGIGATLVRELGAERIEVVPQVSAVQEAFARVGVAWHDALILSAHGRPLEPVVQASLSHPKVAVYTDESHGPAGIAEALLAAGSPDRRTVVAERLGEPDERILNTTLAELKGRQFDALNVLLLLEPIGSSLSAEPASELDDATLHTWNGQLTRRDVRAISIARLCPATGAVVWDVGAGSGAVSIDIARRTPLGRVFAIERDPNQLRCIRANVSRSGLATVTVVEGTAPEVLRMLPDPGAVFIGGTGGRLEEVLDCCWERLRAGGCLVAHFVVLQHLTDCLAWCQRIGVEPDILHVQLARGKPITGSVRLEALDPVSVVTIRRPVEGEPARHRGSHGRP